MKKLFAMAMLLGAGGQLVAQPAIIPQPLKLEPAQGSFTLNASTPLVVTSQSLQRSADFLQSYLKRYHGLALKSTSVSGAAGAITLRLIARVNPIKGAYTLHIQPNGIEITGADEEGVFYGVQSLLQWLPLAKSSKARLSLPTVSIEDSPRFEYRGMMLDVGRHFQPVSYIKTLIDRLAMLKINTLHLHLTEDQGWRIEIKKYPKLTEVGAWRDGTIIGRYPGTGNDNQHYGGFYTQEQIREIVKYAQDRYVTIIPEIEMPGHAGAAIAAYPELSCFPDEETIIPDHPSRGAQARKGKKVMESWGVYEDVFIPSEKTFQFLQDVIDEIIPLFPAKYIHIGGDECPKSAWKRSEFCQNLIREKGLGDEHGLQSYFIQRMEKYINSKGKQIIGWDEILEGGLAPNATVMSWRGEAGGIEAARQQHDVIMSPTTYCYLDYSQTKNEDSITIGGYIPLQSIYSYDPIPKELKGTPEAKFVKGAQANVWTEYMRTAAKVDYMTFPRLAAFAEAVWTDPSCKSWTRFEQKVPGFFDRLDQWGANYSRAYYEINAAIQPAADGQGVQWVLDSKQQDATIRFTAPDAAIDQTYTGPVSVTRSGTYTAKLVDKSGKTLNAISQPFGLHLATGKKISVAQPPAAKYPGNGGVAGLVNGATSHKGLISAEWCAWEGSDMEAVIDLGKVQTVNEVVVNSLESRGSWIYRPSSCQVMLSSDGQSYSPAIGAPDFSKLSETEFRRITIPVRGQSARFLKIQVKHFGKIPEGMAGGGYGAWLFIDEIEVR